MRLRDIVPGAVFTRKATGATRTVVLFDEDGIVVYRDDFGERDCTVTALRNWVKAPTKAERNARRKAREQTS